MADTKVSIAQQLFRATADQSGGSSVGISKILNKMGTFARVVAKDEYGIEQGFAFDSGIIFPILGFNHLVLRGIFQPLERAINKLPDIDKAKAATSTALQALDKPDQFFENAEKHFSTNALAAIRDCIVISANITNAEAEGNEVKLNAQQLTTAEMALRSISAAINKIATDNPEVSGVSDLASDMEKISSHYGALAKKLLPTLSQAPKAGKES